MLQVGKRAVALVKRKVIGSFHTHSLGAKISKICTCVPRQAPGPQDRCIKPRETCGALLLLLHQQEPTADVTCKSFCAAWSQQAATLLSRLTGPSMPLISWPKQVNQFAWISHRKPLWGVGAATPLYLLVSTWQLWRTAPSHNAEPQSSFSSPWQNKPLHGSWGSSSLPQSPVCL